MRFLNVSTVLLALSISKYAGAAVTAKMAVDDFKAAVLHSTEKLMIRAHACAALKKYSVGSSKIFEDALGDLIAAADPAEKKHLQDLISNITAIKLIEDEKLSGTVNDVKLKDVIVQLDKCSYFDQSFFFAVLSEWYQQSSISPKKDEDYADLMNKYLKKIDGDILLPETYKVLDAIQDNPNAAKKIEGDSLKILVEHLPKKIEEAAKIIGTVAGHNSDPNEIKKVVKAVEVLAATASPVEDAAKKAELFSNIVAGVSKNSNPAIVETIVVEVNTKATEKEKVFTKAAQIVSIDATASTNLQNAATSAAIGGSIKAKIDEAAGSAAAVGQYLVKRYDDVIFDNLPDIKNVLADNKIDDWIKRVIVAKYFRKNFHTTKKSLKEAVAAADPTMHKDMLEWIQKKEHKSMQAIKNDITQDHLKKLKELSESPDHLEYFDGSTQFRVLQLGVERAIDPQSRSKIVLDSTLAYVTKDRPISKNFHLLLPAIVEDPAVVKDFVSKGSGGTDMVNVVSKILNKAKDQTEAGKNLVNLFVTLPEANKEALVTEIGKSDKNVVAKIFEGLSSDSTAKTNLDLVAGKVTDPTIKDNLKKAIKKADDMIKKKKSPKKKHGPSPPKGKDESHKIITDAVERYNQEIKIAESNVQISLETPFSSLLSELTKSIDYNPDLNAESFVAELPEQTVNPSQGAGTGTGAGTGAGGAGSIAALESLPPDTLAVRAVPILNSLSNDELGKISPKLVEVLPTSAISQIPTEKFAAMHLASLNKIDHIPNSHLGALFTRMSSRQCSLLSESQKEHINKNESLSSSYQATCADGNAANKLLASWILSIGFGVVGLLALLL